MSTIEDTAAPPMPTPPSTADTYIHLRAGGVSLVMKTNPGHMPSIEHWGAELARGSFNDLRAIAEANAASVGGNAPDLPPLVTFLPEGRSGWSGKPGIVGHRTGSAWSPAITLTDIHVDKSFTLEDGPEDGQRAITGHAGVVRFSGADTAAGLAIELDVEMLSSGLIRTRCTVTNTDDGEYNVEAVSLTFPTPVRAREILDFAGRWGKERTPQRSFMNIGIHEREGRKGRTGADAATILSVGEAGFGFASGEVWGVHTGFSGNHRHYAERLYTGDQVIAGGELLLPGEVRLQQDESYKTPWIYGAYGQGLDDQAARFHTYLRSRAQHPHSPRPVTMNVWEAVYFDHDLDRLLHLADLAAAVGVERYVLDDGWFRHRRSDNAGLGDWFVDEAVWPNGLTPLVDHVKAAGMQFGLWFEPEMINEDSDLARVHPDWIMSTGDRMPLNSRDQQVLNLAIPDAYNYILERISSIVTEYSVDYIKWDHNRDLIDAGGIHGQAGVHAQTLATYRLMGELKQTFPHLEIESCASGGGRVDLGIIEHTDRVWVSDCIDPLDRQQMNRWTMQLLPPEYLGSHVASGVNHITGRSHELSFRAGTAVFGHFGIEWDLATATEQELADLRQWIELYKRERSLFHTGTVVRVDQADAHQNVYGVVAADKREAFFFLAFTDRSEVSPRGRFTLRGLDPDTRYTMTPVLIGAEEKGIQPAPWWTPANPPLTLTGQALMFAGLQPPTMYPERVVCFKLTVE